MKKRSGDDRSNYDFSPSTILTTRYGHESRKLIHVIEKNLLIIMAIIVATVILSILNILGVLESFLFLSNELYIFKMCVRIYLENTQDKKNQLAYKSRCDQIKLISE